MDFFTYQFESPAQFYTVELKDVLDGGGFHQSPELQVGAFLSLIVLYQDEFLDASGQDLVHCCYRLFDSDVYQQHMEAITRSIIDRAVQSPDNNDMWITYHVLLYAGKEFPKVYHWMLKSEYFAKLKYQILQQEGSKLQPLAVNLMYEMCRVQMLREADLALVDETFLNYLLDLVERTRTDSAEFLNYGTIKLLLVFNEQFMLNRALYTQAGPQLAYSGNPLLSVLMGRPGASCTFGENLIFMLNRAEESALQMLILKLLYLVFTNPGLFEFFYTNDLHVLVDVVIRELWDLPGEEESLRHAYLRVMGPLLTNTQLKKATYKRAEIVRVLRELGGGDLDSTLRKQLNKQHLREQLLEQERAQHAKLTYRDRESSSSLASRWASDRSGCSSPVLAFEVEKKRPIGSTKLSTESSADSLKVPGQDELAESTRIHALPHLSSGQEEDESVQIRVVGALPEGRVQDSEHLEELIECARYGELEEIQAVVQTSGLEKAKVLLSHQGEYGKTPLHMAAANGHLDVVEYLITVVAPEAVNIQNEQGNTALHWAATNGHAKVVESLITKGHADYKLKNAAGHTAMMEAELNEREQVVAWMLINTELEEELKEGNDDDEEDSDEESEEEEEENTAQGSSSTAKV
ncbi:hypothetical protein BGZ70_008281 [Mortierella alpina]|uniref:SPIN90/Ldb17 leucine-rich domain-containing protein n=1 Tax=Mortierella alpina TaxID=64518 RepID=A0A9P6M120_MORAP|nr:hypothetical protein BGZ70_008281 [Mortierella alpina]